jgi:hypothetical protein
MKSVIHTLIFILLLTSPGIAAKEDPELSRGQTVYVAIYSNVFTGPKVHPFNLAAMLSIRNTDPHNPLTVLSATYYDNNGNKLKEYSPKPISLAPLASHHYSIKEDDKSGGFGANFIVKWEAAKPINAPIIESLMIGARSGQGISFVCRGKVISEQTE